MGSKRKGTGAERELIHQFWKIGWAAHRIAGSGSSRYPSPDIIAGNGGRILAIECKASKAEYQYFSREEIESLDDFSRKFGAEPFVAVKFNNMGWFFFKTLLLKETQKSYVLSRKMCREHGKSLEEII